MTGNLARSAKVAERAIYFTVRNFYLFIFFNDFSETSYLKICWTDFRNLYVEWKLFGCRWSMWTSFFRYLKGRCHGDRFCAKIGMANSPLSSLWYSESVWARLSSATNATILCKNLVKIGPVVSAENRLIEIALRVDLVVWRISSNISRYTGPIFTIFSPPESTLRVDDGSVPYFQICKGTLPWQPIIVEKSVNLLCGTAILKQIAISQFWLQNSK